MNMIKVRIIHPVPSFVCPFTYERVPPLDVGQTIILPEKVADLLIRKRRAREIIIENPFELWEAKDGN